MECIDGFEVRLKNGKLYENYLDQEGYLYEVLDNVELGNSCYCKYFSYERDWKDKNSFDSYGFPALQGFCSYMNRFMGGYCCSGCNNFEEGKSAGVKTIKTKISKNRSKRNIPERGCAMKVYSQKYKTKKEE